MNERYILSKCNDNNMNVKIGNRVKLVKTNDPYTDLEKNEYIGTVYDKMRSLWFSTLRI